MTQRKTIITTLTGICILSACIVINSNARANPSEQQPLRNLTESQSKAIEHANQLSTAFQCVAEELLPCVVAIESKQQASSQQSIKGLPGMQNELFGNRQPFQGTPFDELLRDRNRPPNLEQPTQPFAPKTVRGIGSGVIIQQSGVVMTNDHVVKNADEVLVRCHDGREFNVKEIRTDPKTDIAILILDNAGNLPAATFGNSDETGIGEWVLALGQPFGLERSVTAGIISAKHRGIGITDRESFIQTDAAINPGNSGGPLVNLRGEIIGINTAIHSRSGGNNGIGFAVPANLASWVANQLLDTGSVQRAYLGVGIQPISSELAMHLSVNPNTGVVITEVLPNTPASEAGLKTGDVITKIGDTKIRTPQELQLAVERSSFNEKHIIKIIRDGSSMDLVYNAKASPSNPLASQRINQGDMVASKNHAMGMTLSTDPTSETKRNGELSNNGITVDSVERNSQAALAGIRPGMVLLEANQQSLKSPDDLFQVHASALEKGLDTIMLLVRENERSRFLVIQIS
ncbi:Do family serine endopeptidase [bacterium]|nr:Do family serine endopeptidase [bacterium]